LSNGFINLPVTGGGIESINGDSTAAQVIAAGSGISVSSSDGTTTITNTGAASDSFTIIQPDHGTSPTASSSTDTLTLTSSDGSVYIDGNSTTKTIDFTSVALPNMYYVNPGIGSDTTGTGAIDAPFATISHVATLIGSAANNSEFNDATKTYYFVNCVGSFTENPTFGTRPFICLDMTNAVLNGNLTVQFNQGAIYGSGYQTPKFIVRSDDLRAGYVSSAFPPIGVNGNIAMQTVGSGSSLVWMLELINTGVTGNITLSEGSGGGSSTLDLFITHSIVAGTINGGSGVGTIVLYADLCDTSGSYALGAVSGTVFLYVLRHVRFDGIVAPGSGSNNASRWIDVQFKSGLAHDFSSAGSFTVPADSVSFANFKANVPTPGSVSFTLIDNVSGVAYTPTTSGDWNSAPSTALAGLDTLATSGIVKSQSANKFLASPNGSSGVPSFRSIVAADVPTLNQNTTGTAAGLSSTLAVGSGGTNSAAALNNNRFMVSSGSAIVEASAVTASRVVVSDSNGLPTASSITTTQINNSLVDQIDGEIASPSNATYTLCFYAYFGFTINSLSIGTDSGTCTVAIQINGTNVTSLSAVSVSSTPSTTSATGANTVTSGQKVTLVVSSNSSSVNLAFSLEITRT